MTSGREIHALTEEMNKLAIEAKARGIDPEVKQDLKAEVQSLKEELSDLWASRIDAWQDCSRRNPNSGSSLPEIAYEEIGSHYRIPPKSVVRQILEALDADHLGWDDDENLWKRSQYRSYFLSLEHNFPEYKKHAESPPVAKSQKRKSASGCLVLLNVPILLIVLFRIL